MRAKFFSTTKAYIKSMRPYTFFVTGLAGILGLLIVGANLTTFSSIIILLLLFTSYGINQVINDIMGTEEDKYNAPKRPLVAGDLPRKTAILSTLFLILAGAVVTYSLNAHALIIYIGAYFMNFLYEYFKGVPVWGNVWFGFMIALAPIFGALTFTKINIVSLFSNYPSLFYIAILVTIASSNLCYYTFFKDYEGDKKAGKNTLIVSLGPKKAKYFNLPFSILPFIVLWFFINYDLLVISTNYIFISLIVGAFLYCVYAAYFTFKNLDKEKKALELNFECIPLFFSALIASFQPYLGLGLFLFSLTAIKLIYWLMYRKDFY